MRSLLPSLIKLLSHIPLSVLYVISDILYVPVYHVVRYRRKIVRKNLTSSFPEKSKAEIISIEKKFYHHFIDQVMETVKMCTISSAEMQRRMKFTNIDHVNDLLRQGKSYSTYIGHYCNWEWIAASGMWLNTYSTCYQIYHKLANKPMDDLMLHIRERFGNTCVPMRETVRHIAKAVHDPLPVIIGFIADQSPKRRESKYFIDFLNHRVPVLTGTEKLTKHFGFGAFFMKVHKVKRGYYEAEFQELAPDPEKLSDFELTDLYFKRLEEEIREHPEYYLWTHNRFKYAIAKSDDSDKSDKSDRSDRSDKSDKSDRSDRSDKSDKSDRSDKSDKA